MDPYVCVPSAQGAIPQATAAGEPLDDPPGVCAALLRIACLARSAYRELRRDCLTKNDRAGGPSECDARRIACGPMSSIDMRAVGRGISTV